ncbi:phosphonoacetate hydrolase [Frankia sp. AiPs1]|uniref:alkaline phosphatase family protein n=1 Tax=Frankia sp. AiPa1 TaxID=573492 RepID=UPI00202B8333|nr:alkaline phosphatase family protein [Frankia sp. AiPa1]MCL9758396.1 alkaline phosphatase family protein [Frankia sp. AiPa1]
MPSRDRVYPLSTGATPSPEPPQPVVMQPFPAAAPLPAAVPAPARGPGSAASGAPSPGSPASGGLVDGSDDLSRAVAALTAPELVTIVDLVAWRDAQWLHVANAAGSARIATTAADGPWELRSGRHPLGSQDPMHGVPLARALADPSPPNERNAYPFAARRLLSAFGDATRSPDLIVIHTPGHYWPERGGHLGEHGSLDAAQSRAPLVLSGAGVHARGPRDAVARVVDIAPTLAALAGVTMPGVEGTPLTDLVTSGARHVVGLLWDGANCNDLLDLARSGALPNVARLLANGTALSGGAIAEFPSVTLTNHTSALTGVGPGRHGILHNVYFDRAIGRQVIVNDVRTWHTACDQLRDGVETLFEAVARQRPHAVTACVNEPVDRGAHYSTFGLVRAAGIVGGAGDMGDHLPPLEGDPHTTAEWASKDPDYAWSSRVDALGLTQVLQLWAPDVTPPDVMWWNTTVTDTGHHGGGPYSSESRAALRDADARLGAFLGLLADRDLLANTAFLLTADHGSEAADPGCRGDWGDALRDAGVRFRDEGYGFVYLGALTDTAM